MGTLPIGNERVKGIEPSCAAWEAAVLPLNYTRDEIFDFRFAIADCNRNKMVVQFGCLRRITVAPKPFGPAVSAFPFVGRARHAACSPWRVRAAGLNCTSNGVQRTARPTCRENRWQFDFAEDSGPYNNAGLNHCHEITSSAKTPVFLSPPATITGPLASGPTDHAITPSCKFGVAPAFAV